MGIQIAVLLGVLTLGLLTPGPDFLVVVRNSVGATRIRGFATVLGITTGLAIQTSLVSLGVGALPPRAIETVALAGAVFLAWLGLRTFFEREDGEARIKPASTRADARSGFAQGFACNLTNPKAFLFFVSVFAQALPSAATWVWHIGLPVLVVTHGAIVWSLVVLTLQSGPLASRFARVQHWLPRVFGVVLLLFAAFIVWGAIAE